MVFQKSYNFKNFKKNKKFNNFQTENPLQILFFSTFFFTTTKINKNLIRQKLLDKRIFI